MCGILGTIRRSAASSDAFERAMQHLAHRGPDDAGTYCDVEAGVYLGHRRLSIIDLSPLGHQPMWSRNGRVAIVFNGEIYNFRELRAELESRGTTFRGHSDTEVLLELFASQGLAMLPKLNGIFAVALYDRESREVTLARDAMGVKPLYYSEHADGFSFASEIKALLPLLPEARGLNHAALHRYLSFLWCPGGETPLQGVFKLLPGEHMSVREGRVVRRSTWFELPLQRPPTDSPPRTNDAIEAARSHLRTAVHRQMVSDVPVGAFLSGGLDSSAVVAFARELAPKIQCFTIESSGGHDAGDVEDLPYARRVAAHLNVPLEVVRIDSSRMASDLEQMVYMLDEPLADPAPLNVLYISQLARQNGAKVLLSGAGGDDLFTGYRRHMTARFDSLWDYIPRSVRNRASRATDKLNKQRPLARRIAKLVGNAAQTGDARIAGYFAWAGELQLRSLYSETFRAAVLGVRADQPMLDFLATIPQQRSTLERMLSLEQRFFLADHNLPYTDKMSMAVGVEVRVPFLDLDLVHFASTIRDSDKLHGTTAKWVLKKAMEPYLPHDVIYRAKTGFGAPLRRWMKSELRELVGDLLSVESLKKRGLFEAEAVQRLIADNDAGRSDGAYTLLSIMCLEIWCRRFLDQRTDRNAALYAGNSCIA